MSVVAAHNDLWLVDNGNILVDGRVLFHQLFMVFFQHRGRDVEAAVVLDDGGCKAQVAFADEEDAVLCIKRNRGDFILLLLAELLVRLGFILLLRLLLRLRLLGKRLLRLVNLCAL